MAPLGNPNLGLETHPVWIQAKKIEKIAIDLKDDKPTQAFDLKLAADTILMCTEAQFHRDRDIMVGLAETATKLDRTLKRIELLDAAKLAKIIDDANELQREEAAKIFRLATDTHDEDGASARSLTDMEWLRRYRNMDEASIQNWTNVLTAAQHYNATVSLNALKRLAMEEGGERLWRVMNNAVLNPHEAMS